MNPDEALVAEFRALNRKAVDCIARAFVESAHALWLQGEDETALRRLLDIALEEFEADLRDPRAT